MKLFILILFIVTFVTSFPVTLPLSGDIDVSDPFAPTPVERPITSRPVRPRSVERIGSRSLESRQTVPNAYIIEFREGYTHDAFKAYLAEKEVLYEVRTTYNYPNIFMGISIQLKNGADYAKVASWVGVQGITPVSVVTIPPFEG